MGAVDLVARLGGGGALAGVGALVGDGLVEEVAAEGEVEVRRRVGLEVEGLEGREGVDRDGDGRGWAVLAAVREGGRMGREGRGSYLGTTPERS